MEFDRSLFIFLCNAVKIYKEYEKLREPKWRQVKIVQFDNCEAKAIALAAYLRHILSAGMQSTSRLRAPNINLI